MQKKKSFALGFSLVLHSLIMYLVSSWIVALSANYIIPAMAGKFGMDTGIFYSINTYAALISVVAAFLLSQLTLKCGVRFVTVISLIISGLAAVLAGYTTSLALYVVAVILLFCFAQGYGFVVTNTLMSNWFPRKKAVILGITTAGTYVANLTLTPAFSSILNKSGIGSAMLMFGIVCFVLGIVSIFWIKNKPEDVGLYPDNDATGLEELNTRQASAKNYQSPWTIGRLLRTPIVWFFVIAFGFMLLMSSGVPAQIVPMLISRGVAPLKATQIMMVSSLAGIVGSITTGFIDKKVGARITSLIMGVTFLISLGLMAISTNVTLTIIMLFVWTFFGGGCFNMCPSLAITIFGAKDYNAVNRIIHPLTQVIKACSFITIGLTSALGSGYSGTMWAFFIFVIISMIFVIPIKKNGKLDPCKEKAQ